MIEIFFLSLIQGITEFLPISSSSHLILISEVFNFKNQNLTIDVSSHIGSFLAVIVYFHKDIINFVENRILFLKILISSLPVMTIGLVLVKTGIIDKIRNIETIAWMTIIFGVLLYLVDKFKNVKKSLNNNFNYKSVIIIGCLQILSLIPGVSRSGIAITAARFLNYNRIDSAKISFFLSIPILGAVSLFGIIDIVSSQNFFLTKLNLITILFSFFFSLITIKYFLIYINKFDLSIFAFYRILLGLILLYNIYL